ncbi:hypothetical protein H6G06_07225 [Anabaena sphaerica FACHB-251]|uniref:Uncharacterized protein n=1 Tax=Anabaena sphaerica FACHB-251 TaxID=2692883 RepID=A0A926WFM9_9NOST|nr:hypothetical protein [Anabaena sphaerica FACHB-251]
MLNKNTMVLASIASHASCKVKAPKAINHPEPTKAMVGRFVLKPGM